MDIFLSYSSKDRGRIESLVQALEGQGWSVFWDRQHILPGEAFGPVIEKHLAAVKCVVAVWSEHSVAPESYWVQNEAATGLQRGILVPVTIDDVVAPIAFRHLQSAQMIGWPGQSNSRELDLLLRTVARYV